MDSSTLILVLSSLGIAQAVFLCLYLFTLKKGTRAAHFFLGLIILGLTIRIGKSVLNEYFQLAPWQRNLGIAGILMVGPSLWFYGRTLFARVKKSRKVIALHYIPYVLFCVFCWIIPNRFDKLSLIIYYAVFAHLFFYIILSAKLYSTEKNHPQRRLLTWYRNLVIGVSIICFFYVGNVMGLIPFYIGGAICYTFLIYIFSFLLLKKHSFQLEKYKGQRLDSQTSNKIMSKLQKLFENESIYLNPNISLSEVAHAVDTTPRVLSRLINERTKQNFSEYVNSYRVEKAKSLLISKESKHEKIAAIAYDSGFNNVTSFNLAFKAMTQLTPSQFREQTS